MEKTVAAQDLQVKIVEIKGRCPVYAIGDGFRILGGWKLQAQRPICLHALSSLMPYYVALSRGIPPSDLGLGDAETATVQCLDPCERTGGGTVIFAIQRVRESRKA